MMKGSTRTVQVSGAELDIWEGGRGRPLVYLHPGDGRGGSEPFMEGLADRYRVVAPSHPGFDRSSLPRSFSSVDDLTHMYLEFLRQEGLEDAVLVGASFGGWIAAEVAVKRAGTLAGLVLIDTLGAKFQGPMTREITDLFSTALYDHWKILYHRAEAHRPDHANWPQEALVQAARNNESFALFGWSPTLHNPKLAQRLHQIEAPALVVWGDHDRVVSPDYGRSFAAAIPGARFELIAEAGHYPQVEQPDATSRSVLGFLDALVREHA